MHVDLFIIKEEYLPKLPPAVQRFVRDYFRKERVFGIECLSASSSDDRGTEVEFCEDGDTYLKNGNPHQSKYQDTPEYKDGLDLETYPNGATSWLHKEREKHPEGIFHDFIYVFDD
jgi:hypothetical protein